MIATQDIMDELLLRYFTAETSAEEVREVEEWSDASPENAQALEQAWFVWQCSEKLRIINAANPKQAFQSFKRRLKAGYRGIILRRYWRITQRAAAILLIPVASLAIHYFRLNHNETHQWAEVRTSTGMVSKCDLPDGSVVWLNSGGILRYPLRFKANRREVELRGQGYFQVKRDSVAPFFIKVNEQYRVEVIGTEFNVTAYENDPLIETTLVDGSVRLNIYKENGQLVYRTLRPNQKAVFNRNNNMLEVTEVDTEYDTAWREGRMVFKNHPMEYVLKTLSRHYNVRFNLKGHLGLKSEITAKFTNETLEQVLEYLSLASDIRFRIKHPNLIKDDSLDISEIEVSN